MKDLIFEYRGFKYKAQYSVTRMPFEDHYFVFPVDRDIIDIVGNSFTMHINKKPGADFYWNHPANTPAGQIKVVIAKAIKDNEK